MVLVPTWIDMVMLLVAFVMTGLQYRFAGDEGGPVFNIRFGLLIGMLFLMILTVFLNTDAGWMSVGLFLAALACFGLSFHMWRYLPPRRPNV